MMMDKAMQQGAFLGGAPGRSPLASASPGPPVEDPYGEGANEQLFQCPTCDRRMTERALGPHSNACGKGPRKKFDMAKARVEGTEAAEFVKKNKGKGAQVAGGRAGAQAKTDVNGWVLLRRADPCKGRRGRGGA